MPCRPSATLSSDTAARRCCVQRWKHSRNEWGSSALEEAVEGVVAGNAAHQFEKSFEPVPFGAAEIFHVIEALAPQISMPTATTGDVQEAVLLGAVDLRVG